MTADSVKAAALREREAPPGGNGASRFWGKLMGGGTHHARVLLPLIYKLQLHFLMSHIRKANVVPSRVSDDPSFKV